MGRSPYPNRLTESERAELRSLVAAGQRPVRDVRRAHIILLSDAGLSRDAITRTLGASTTTVDRTRYRWRAEGAQAAIRDRPRSGRPPTLTPRDEARIVALAGTPAPAGAARWAHRALTAALRTRRRLRRPVGRETVRQVLHRHHLKPWKKGGTGASRP